MKLCECGCGEPVALAPFSIPDRGWLKGQPIRFVRGHNSRIHPTRPMSGRQHTAEARHKMSLRTLGQHTGEANFNWRGDDVGYYALHQWVGRHKPKTGRCSTCSFVGFTEWANISGLYFRDLEDYAELCKDCHHEFDGYANEI